MKFDSSFDVNEDSTNSMEVLYSPCYYQLSQNIMLLKKRTTTPITSNTKVTKNSKDAITYCMSLFEDYITMSSCKFTFLIIRCYCNFYIVLYQQCSAMIFILFVVITLYQLCDVDISYINNIEC